MGFWKTKVVPTVKKLFEKDAAKKTAAAEASKSFDDSKEEISKEFEEKKEELKPKVLEIYEASSAGLKTAVKERTVASIKKQTKGVNAFLEELVKAEFPGAKAVSELSSKYGPSLVPEPIFFLFEKVAVFLPVEEPKSIEPAEEKEKEKEEIKEEKKEEEEVKEEKVEEKEEAVPAPPTPETAAEIEKKVEEAAPPKA